MTKTAQEILDENYFNIFNCERQEVIDCMEAYANQQTATLYTKEQVQKIVENVREALINETKVIQEGLPVFGNTINKNNLRSLDLDQFIKK